jgi:integrase
MKGKGCVFLRGKIWWIRYYRIGKPFSESSQSKKKTDALTLLASRMGNIADHKPLPVRKGVLMSELLDDVLNDYKANGLKSIDTQRQRIEKHLKPYFGQSRAEEITGADISRYVVKRQTEEDAERKIKPAKNATINRELSALLRCFSLGVKYGKIRHVPHFEMLKENNARQGFFEEDKFWAVWKELPDYLKPIAEFANLSGWRKSEILGLEWREVDLDNASIRLDAQKTKNQTARTVYMSKRLRDLLKTQRELTDMIQKLRGRIIPNVFHRNGQPIGSFYKAWRTACVKAGVPGMLLHDFRRTHVRRSFVLEYRSGSPCSKQDI